MSQGRLGSWALVGLVGVSLAACSTTASRPAVSPPTDHTGQTLKLAAVLSLTGPGEVLGDPQKKGIDLAVESINGSGGINGARIAVDIKDDASNPQQSAGLFQKLTADNQTLGLIGPSLAIAAAAAHPVASGLKTPVIAPSLTGAGVVGKCAYACTHVFRDSLGEATAIPDNVKTLSRNAHPRTALIIYANDDTSATANAALFQQALADDGIAVPTAGVVQVAKNATAVGDVVAAAVAQKVDAWMISTPGPLAVLLMKEARKQGFKGPFAGGNSFNSAAVARLAGEAGAGAQSAAAYFMGLDIAANRAFLSAYRARYKDADGKAQDPDQVAAQAFAAVVLFAAAARTADLAFGGAEVDRPRLEAALGRASAETPMGTISFAVENDIRQPVYVVAADGKGGFSLVQTYPSR